MKINYLKLTFSLALMGIAATAQAQTYTASQDPLDGGASSHNIGNFPQTPTPDATGNDFTNQFVTPTPEYYTNNQAAVAADQQYRIQEEGPAKQATALENGPHIEPRPPTSFLATDPWVEQDHPWDFDNNLADSMSP